MKSNLRTSQISRNANKPTRLASKETIPVIEAGPNIGTSRPVISTDAPPQPRPPAEIANAPIMAPVIAPLAAN